MEISVIESGISRFQNPDFLLLHLKILWTWAALILAAIATFNSLIRRSKRVILGFRRHKSAILKPSTRTYSSDDEDDVSCSSSSDDDDVSCSSPSDAGDEMDSGDFEELIPGQNGKYDHHFTWPCYGSVVKLWDGIPALHVEAVLSGGAGGLKVWDARADGEACVSASWQVEGIGRMMGIRVGMNDDEVYVGDDEGKLTVVDLRSVRAPLAERWCGGSVVDGDWMVLT